MARDLHATPLYPRVKALETGVSAVGASVDAKIKASETSTKAYVDQQVRNVGIGSTNTQIKSNKDAIIVNSTRISANSVDIAALDIRIDDLLGTDLDALNLAIQQERDERIAADLALSGSVQTNTGDIASLDGRVDVLEAVVDYRVFTKPQTVDISGLVVYTGFTADNAALTSEAKWAVKQQFEAGTELWAGKATFDQILDDYLSLTYS